MKKKKARTKPYVRPYTRTAVLLPKTQRYNWLVMKKTFLADPTISLTDLAKKYKVSQKTLLNKARRERWMALREEIQKRAEERMIRATEEKLSEVKMRHSQIGKMLQHEGVKAIRKGKGPKTPKQALKFTTEGVRIEREAEGVEKRGPAIVNIVQQQKAVVDKYRFEEGEVVE